MPINLLNLSVYHQLLSAKMACYMEHFKQLFWNAGVRGGELLPGRAVAAAFQTWGRVSSRLSSPSGKEGGFSSVITWRGVTAQCPCSCMRAGPVPCCPGCRDRGAAWQGHGLCSPPSLHLGLASPPGFLSPRHRLLLCWCPTQMYLSTVIVLIIIN